MARKVFFSFHYDDVLAVNVVRNANVISARYQPAARTFFDKGLWEAVKKRGNQAIKAEIDRGLEGSSVTCVLIGHQTWERPWVRYEVLASLARGNGLLGVNIHDVGPVGALARGLLFPTAPGPNPFDYLGFRQGDGLLALVELLQWDGHRWIEHPHLGQPFIGMRPELVGADQSGRLSKYAPVYDWRSDNGAENASTWIERAAIGAGRR